MTGQHSMTVQHRLALQDRLTLQDGMTAYWSRWADEYDDQQTARLRSADARRTWRDMWEHAARTSGTPTVRA